MGCPGRRARWQLILDADLQFIHRRLSAHCSQTDYIRVLSRYYKAIARIREKNAEQQCPDAAATRPWPTLCKAIWGTIW